ncbi:MAG: hydrogenase maturation nickel metallochaperone HypA [Pseudomonadota bacterium]
MHELAVTEGILKVVLRHAAMNGASRIVGVGLRIGELADLADEWLQRYFDYLSRDTIAAGARIRVERIPVIFRCEACGKAFPVKLSDIKDVVCPACGPGKVILVSGREFTVQQIEVI